MMGVSPKTVHVWLADPDGSVARERKRRYHDGVCRDCGGPCYRYWSDWQGGHTAWRCQKCERRRLHEQRKWTKTKVKAALVRWADDLGRPPTAQETGLPGTRVPYRAIQRELGGFNTALKAAGLPRRLPGQRAGQNGVPDRSERPWDDGLLHERFYSRDRRRRPNCRLPQLATELAYPPLGAPQLRELRAQWLACRVTLRDFADRRQCSREILVNTHVTLDELMVILCAAVGFSDTEHLYTLGFAIPQWPDWMGMPEQYAHPYHASTIDAEPATQVTLADAGPNPGSRLYMRYDFGDDWRFHGRFHQVPKRVAPALWAHARLTDTPAAQSAQRGKAPDQYPHAERW